MHLPTRPAIAALTLAVVFALPATLAAAQGETKKLDNFEKEPDGWKFVGGEEFPGATGAFARDTKVAHESKVSYRIDADFSKGGAYVGCFKEMSGLAPDVKEIHLWVKSDNVGTVGVRIIDSTGQCHQLNGGLSINPKKDWQEIVLRPSEIVGGEHWGGSNDGQWHGPAHGFGLNIGKGAFVKDTPAKGSLWIDDITYVVAEKKPKK